MKLREEDNLSTMDTTADFILSPMSGACQCSEVLLYTITGNMEMPDGLYCVLSFEHGTEKWMDWLVMQHVNRLKRLYEHQTVCSGL